MHLLNQLPLPAGRCVLDCCQKLVSFSRDGSLVAVGISNNQVRPAPALPPRARARLTLTSRLPTRQVSIHSYPSLEPAFNMVHFPGFAAGDVYDVDFDESGKFVRAFLVP